MAKTFKRTSETNRPMTRETIDTYRIDPRRSFLLIVDMQEKLVPALQHASLLVDNVAILAQAAGALDLPCLATEHCADRIGVTVPPLRAYLDSARILKKTHFCATAEPAALSRLKALDRDQAILCGAEAHVCVLQTAFGLREAGFRPYLVANATGSRFPANKALALTRLRDGGIPAVSAEMVLFEWLERADQPLFKEVLSLIKRLQPLPDAP